MKTYILIALTAALLFFIPNKDFAQTPTLGHSAGFVLFTTNGAMTCSGTKYLMHLTGNVGSNLPGSVTGFGNVDGVMHTADVATGLCVPDVVSLYTQLSTAIPTNTLASPFGSGTILVAGTYFLAGASTLTGTLILDGQGNPNAQFIFQINGVLTTNSLSKVKLINGAMACNVFWQIGGAVNVGTGTSLKGTIVANGQIDMTSTLDTLEGRALAMNAAVLVSQLVAYTPIGCGSALLTGPVAPAMLDSTAAYGVFSTIGAVTSTPITYVIGNVGGNSAAPTGFNPLNVTGTIHSMDPSTVAAAADLTNIYNYLVALPADIQLLDPADFGYGLVLTPHSYQITGITQLTGNIILNGEGDPNAVFVIKINGALTTGAGSKILLINGTQAKNVYWKVDGAVDIYSNSVFNGTLIVAGAISLETGDTLNGRALTINGAIAINGSYVKITPNPCVAPAIGGVLRTCPGGTSVLTNTTMGGKWSSMDTTVATIDSNLGRATGIRQGNTQITYTTVNGCINTAIFTVNAAPSAITGPGSVCTGDSITLVDTSAGGLWSSSNNLVASVGSLSGHVSGVLAGRDTIIYTVASGCTATKPVTVNSTNAGVINGLSVVCAGSSITLTDTSTGGIWSSSNADATVLSGVVTGVLAGIDTIKYSVANICGTATATKAVTVNALSNSGIITGPATVCAGSAITLTDLTPGGTWSTSNNDASVGTAGVVTGLIAGVDTISYTVTGICGTAASTKTITINPLPNAGSITGLSIVCVGSSITLTDGAAGGIWSSSNANATVLSGTVTGVSAGIDTIMYTVTNLCGTVSATKAVTVNLSSNSGVITGPATVCAGSTITLTDLAPGGAWSSSNANASVGSTGIVTGLVAGIDTISYTVTGICGTAASTKTITVNPLPNAGSISGLSTVCVGSSITLTDGAAGGIWSSSSANATVLSGVVTGVSAGIDTIKYTVANLCGTAIATQTVTVNLSPNSGIITGPSAVCAGSAITLTDLAAGGAWSSSNTNASVGTTGIVTGLIAGVDTISYTVTGICGTSNATKTITVRSLPNAGSISGLSTVCVGSSVTLTDGAAGGTWSSGNLNANVTGGTVTGVSSGTDIISYVVTNLCGTATATQAMTINPLPNAGTITGLPTVCVASSITLTDLTGGGTWSSGNTNATVGTTGVVTGITAGPDVISYSVSNMCGTAAATKSISVNPLPNAGTIAGPSSVCVSSSVTLTDGAAGGIWSSSNGTAIVSGGVVTGVTAGMDTVIYTVTNVCGTATTTSPVTINPLPVAGSISGPSTVCVSSSITLTDGATGGVWSASNANAAVSGGVVTGVNTGADNISYSVSNMCGTAITVKPVLINPLPNAGSITGASSVCVMSAITLADGITGGAWSSSNATATIGSAGIVAGVTAGTDTIMYAVTNMCGTATTTKSITINPLPNAGSITGPASVCVNAAITLTDGAAGGIWSSSNTAAVIGATGVVTGIRMGMDTIAYAVTNVCGTATVTKSITVNPLPFAGSITGVSKVCIGSSINLTDAISGGVWSASNANVAISSTGVVTGVTAGTVTTRYAVTNVCGTDTTTKTITVNVLPLIPVISTQAPSSACTGTMYQNYGTATPPPAGSAYNWTATNAIVWAQGTGHQYALVNFVFPGTADVTLNAVITATQCASHNTVVVNAGTGIAQTATVTYFNNHFVCTPNNEGSYQWGYDDAYTLDSTILTGEINQDYINTNPDYANKAYWAMTTLNGCLQKTYFHVPTIVQNVNDATGISVYPNPARSIITVEITSADNSSIQVEVLNMIGQKVMTANTTDNKTVLDVNALPAGSYIITCYRNGINIAHAGFTKN